jgi:hypothetical protein
VWRGQGASKLDSASSPTARMANLNMGGPICSYKHKPYNEMITLPHIYICGAPKHLAEFVYILRVLPAHNEDDSTTPCRGYLKAYAVDVNRSHTPGEGAHSPSWPHGLITRVGRKYFSYGEVSRVITCGIMFMLTRKTCYA